ncbi:unnamed protein product [Caretta caretta]
MCRGRGRAEPWSQTANPGYDGNHVTPGGAAAPQFQPPGYGSQGLRPPGSPRLGLPAACRGLCLTAGTPQLQPGPGWGRAVSLAPLHPEPVSLSQGASCPWVWFGLGGPGPFWSPVPAQGPLSRSLPGPAQGRVAMGAGGASGDGGRGARGDGGRGGFWRLPPAGGPVFPLAPLRGAAPGSPPGRAPPLAAAPDPSGGSAPHFPSGPAPTSPNFGPGHSGAEPSRVGPDRTGPGRVEEEPAAKGERDPGCPDEAVGLAAGGAGGGPVPVPPSPHMAAPWAAATQSPGTCLWAERSG